MHACVTISGAHGEYVAKRDDMVGDLAIENDALVGYIECTMRRNAPLVVRLSGDASRVDRNALIDMDGAAAISAGAYGARLVEARREVHEAASFTGVQADRRSAHRQLAAVGLDIGEPLAIFPVGCGVKPAVADGADKLEHERTKNRDGADRAADNVDKLGIRQFCEDEHEAIISHRRGR